MQLPLLCCQYWNSIFTWNLPGKNTTCANVLLFFRNWFYWKKHLLKNQTKNWRCGLFPTCHNLKLLNACLIIQLYTPLTERYALQLPLLRTVSCKYRWRNPKIFCLFLLFKFEPLNFPPKIPLLTFFLSNFLVLLSLELFLCPSSHLHILREEFEDLQKFS